MRMLARTAAVLVFVTAATAGTLHAQDFSSSQPILLPPQFYVGDRVEMRILVRVASGVALTVPKSLPESHWIVFHSITVTPHGSDSQEVRIDFTPYHPGTLPFPPIDLGRVVLRDLNIYVQPVLGNRQVSLRPPFQQLLVPNTRLIIGAVVGVILVVPLLWLGFYRIWRKQLAGFLEKLRENRPYRRLMKNLKQLGQNAGELTARDFYIALLSDLRIYLTRKTGVDCAALTTSEIEPLFPPLLLDESEHSTLVEIFRYGDLVKFAGRSASVRQRKQQIDALLMIIAAGQRRSVQRPPEAGDDGGEPPKKRAVRFPRGMRKRRFVPTFHREPTPRAKESRQHVDP